MAGNTCSPFRVTGIKKNDFRFSATLSDGCYNVTVTVLREEAIGYRTLTVRIDPPKDPSKLMLGINGPRVCVLDPELECVPSHLISSASERMAATAQPALELQNALDKLRDHLRQYEPLEALWDRLPNIIPAAEK